MLLSNTITTGHQTDFNIPPTGSNAIVFTIDKECMTSAGVFSKEKRLIKTLWSGRKYDAGTYTEQWDGTNDEGNLVPGGNYDITIVSNNMEYKWEGVVGNTSRDFTGEHIYHNNFRIYSMAIYGDTAYYACGYNEKKASQQKFNIHSPQLKSTLRPNEIGQSSIFAATDGNLVYWAGYNSSRQWFVFGTKISDDSEVIFANSEVVKPKTGRTYNAIGAAQQQNVAITGLAVQTRGNYLFVAYQGANEIHVLDKIKGSLVRKIAKEKPSALATDRDDNLWVCYKTTIEKFAVQQDGNLSSLQIVITDVANAQAVAVSPDNKTVLIADGGINSQQIKAYSNNAGKALWIFGRQGGYYQSAEVADDKFYFTDVRKAGNNTFLCFAPDGSFWVGDSGNYRIQYYDSNRKFIERIMYIPTFYTCTADKNNPERVFATYLEFAINYTKPLAPDNGSWKLVNNWGCNIPKSNDAPFFQFNCVVTLSNNRTYAMLFQKDTKDFQIVELGVNHSLRFTGIVLESTARLYEDGSVRKVSPPQIGKPAVWTIQKLTGFSSNGNPQWEAEKQIASSPPNSNQEPLYKDFLPTLRPGEITTSGVLISYDDSHPPKGNNGWHLGGIKLGEDQWLWRTAASTKKDYGGDFPPDGYFDIGNKVQYAGSAAMVLDNHIFWGYHGEAWKASETNKWNQVYHNGLFINQFGLTGPQMQLSGKEAVAEWAGNVFGGAIVKTKAGDVYLYHNDESAHGGMHRWKISGFDTVKEQNLSVSLSYPDKGLLGVYFKNKDLNNCSIVATARDKSIQFPSLPSGSVRWTGFLKSDFTEKYTLYISTNGKVRLWLHDDLALNQWNNATDNEFTVTSPLSSQVAVPLKIELSGASRISLSWSSPHQQKEVIGIPHLTPAANPYTVNKYNLLDGLASENIQVLEDNLYGWKRSPAAEDTTQQFKQWWSVRTNVKTYHPERDADIFVQYAEPTAGIYTVARDIDLLHPLTSWNINGLFDFKGNFPNDGNAGGSFFDITDANGKIIARLYFGASGARYTLYGNNDVITSDNDIIRKRLLQNKVQVVLSAAKGIVSFAIDNLPVVQNNPFDISSEWNHPAAIQLSFFTKTKPSNRVIDLQNLTFTIT